MKGLLKPMTQSIKLWNGRPCSQEMSLVSIMWAIFRTRASLGSRNTPR